jgi:hypothetical protein
MALAALLTVLVAMLAGCTQGQATVPSGGQLVHLVATQSEVRLSPAAVHAGDVFIQLDVPLDGGSFTFVVGAASAGATPGPLSDDDLARIAYGDMQNTGASAYGPSCSGAQGAAVGHLSGPGVCGDVWQLTLTPGRYAILGPGWTPMQVEPSVAPTANPAGFIAPPTMAVLTVLP